MKVSVRGVQTYGGTSIYSTGPCAVFYLSGIPPSLSRAVVKSDRFRDLRSVQEDVVKAVLFLIGKAFGRLSDFDVRGWEEIGYQITPGVGPSFWISTPPSPAVGAAVYSIGTSIASILSGHPAWPLLPKALWRRWLRDLEAWQRLAPLVFQALSRDLPVDLSWHYDFPAIYLGYGKNQHRVLGSTYDCDMATTVLIGSDKLLCRSILSRLRVPLAEGGKVDSISAARKLAGQIGFPVVLKHPGSSNSVGVVLNIRNNRHLQASFEHLRTRFPSGPLLLEKMLSGKYYRALVIDGRCLRVSEGSVTEAIGDGVGRVGDILRPKKHLWDEMPLEDEQLFRTRNVLLGQGLALNSIPRAGCAFAISPATANWRDRSADVHPANRLILETVGRFLSPSVLGIDIICREIGEKWQPGRDGIVEVNSSPGLWFHDDQGGVASALLDRLYPGSATSRIPIVCFAGSESYKLAKNCAEMLRKGRTSILAKCNAVIESASLGDTFTAREVLDDPEAEAACLALDWRSICENGLPFDRCDVLVLSSDVHPALGAALLRTVKTGGVLVTPRLSTIPREGRDCIRQSQLKIVRCEPKTVAAVHAAIHDHLDA